MSLQAVARGFVARRRSREIRAARSVQAASRGFLARRRYRRALRKREELRAREAELKAMEEARNAELKAMEEEREAARKAEAERYPCFITGL